MIKSLEMTLLTFHSYAVVCFVQEHTRCFVVSKISQKHLYRNYAVFLNNHNFK